MMTTRSASALMFPLCLFVAACATGSAFAPAATGTGVVAMIIGPILAVIDAIFGAGGMTEAQHSTLRIGLQTLGGMVTDTMATLDTLKHTTTDVSDRMPTTTTITGIGVGLTTAGLALYRAIHGAGPTAEEAATRRVAHAHAKLAKVKAKP